MMATVVSYCKHVASAFVVNKHQIVSTLAQSLTYSKILTHTLELVTNIGVILVFAPLLLQKVQSLLKDMNRANSRRVRCLDNRDEGQEHG